MAFPPTVAAASAASQVTGAKRFGRPGPSPARRGRLPDGRGDGRGRDHRHRIGALLFRLLQELGQIDTVINVLYVLLLGTIGG
jgi:hypothetical protein